MTREKEETNGELTRRVYIEISKATNNTEHKNRPPPPHVEDTTEIINPKAPADQRKKYSLLGNVFRNVGW